MTPELLGVVAVGELEIDVDVLCTECVGEPGHHVGDLGPVDVVALVRESPGESQEAETGELFEDVDHLGQVHLAAPDGERESQPLQALETSQLSDLLWGEASVAQHSLRLNLQHK